MQGIKFGEFHSFDDFGLYIAPEGIVDIPPKVQEKYITVPFRNKLLDASEIFGKVAYDKRTPKYTFVTIKPTTGWDDFLRNISNAIHGKVLQIIYDRDPQYYLQGRVQVNNFQSDKSEGKVVIDAVCDPFKYKIDETIETVDVDGTATIVLKNEKMTVYPKVTTTAQIKVQQGENTHTYGIVTNHQTKIKLTEGENELTLTGTGSISFIYQEGVL